MKCKNVECNNDVKKGRVYCSLTCRNVYVNTHLRDYSKNGKGLREACGIESEYLKNPKKCKQCGNPIEYKKRWNKFCGSSCGATHTNKNRCKSVYVRQSETMKRLGYISPKRLNDERVAYLKAPNKCINCNSNLPFNKRTYKFCSQECRSLWSRDDSLQSYRLQCKFNFNLSDYPTEFDFGLVKEHGWYRAKNRGDNLYGVSRDHIYSVKDGFLNNINPLIIAHPANCRLMLHSDNVSKYTDSGITIEELLERIKEWDKKYGLIV